MIKNKTCINCGIQSPLISKHLKLCLNCIRVKFNEIKPIIDSIHKKTREAFKLPAFPPKHINSDSEKIIRCSICVHECSIDNGEVGYCGLRKNVNGKLEGVTTELGNLSWYHDSLPTNCVADWVCAGGTGSGYPKYSYSSNGPEYGYKNLAVFFHACSFNCLFCQNWHYREQTFSQRKRNIEELVEAIDKKTSCICYFGGDPTPQLPYAIAASRSALQKKPGNILRICWETNGIMNPSLLDEMVDLSLTSGGCIKFDLKAYSESVNYALCGVSNERVLENFARAARRIKDRPDPPLLIASTLLVPGYIDAIEIKQIAKFIASLDKSIPYVLLAYYPHFYMSDLPFTSRSFAEECLSEARNAGLLRVRIGNVHILDYNAELE